MAEDRRQIYIRGFSRSTREEDLRKAFEEYGEVKECRIVSAYAFVVQYILFRPLRSQKMLKLLLIKCKMLILRDKL